MLYTVYFYTPCHVSQAVVITYVENEKYRIDKSGSKQPTVVAQYAIILWQLLYIDTKAVYFRDLM